MSNLLDDMSRIIASPVSRRKALTLVSRAAGGAVLAALGLEQATWAVTCSPGHVLCNGKCCAGGQICCNNKKCCSQVKCCNGKCCESDQVCNSNHKCVDKKATKKDDEKKDDE